MEEGWKHIGVPTLARTGLIILATAIALLLTQVVLVTSPVASLETPGRVNAVSAEARDAIVPTAVAVKSERSVDKVALSTAAAGLALARPEGATNTIRIYGRSSEDAAFPYAAGNYMGPFALTNAEAPPKDFVQFNPAIMLHDDEDSLGQFGEYFRDGIKAGGDASEKVHLRMWYVPEYPEPRGLTYPEVTAPVSNAKGDIVLEYTYMLLGASSLNPKTGPPESTLMVFPMAGLGEQAGLDRMDVNGDGELEALSVDGIVGVLTGTLGVHEVITHPEGIPDDVKTTRGIIKVSPKETQNSISVSEGGQVQFLDYMAQLEGVSASGNWADVSVWYIGGGLSLPLGTVRMEMDQAALVSRFWGPSIERFATEAEAEAAAKVAMVTEGLPARPLWLTLDSIVQVGGEPHARLTPHRLLMTGETFFVDGVEYDVVAILVEDADLTVGEIAPEIKYITLRNPLPKGDGALQIPELTIEKRRIPAGEDLWMLPPFNYQHDMVDDVNIPEKPNDLGPDDQKADNDSSVENDVADGYDLIEERIVADVLALNGDLAIEWIAEDKEKRFDTNLLEEKLVQEQTGDAWDEGWQWINVETRPWRYTEFILPELPDKPTQAGYTTGDYVLVSSFLTEDSITTTQGAGAVRVKFAHDAQTDLASSADIYVGDATLRVYGMPGEDAAFPYVTGNYTGPFGLANDEAPSKDFVQFNPAIMLHDDEDSLGQFGEYFRNGIKADGDASEKVHLRMWYVPEYPEPRGLTYPEVTVPVSNAKGDIVLEYTYMLLDASSLDPKTGSPESALMVFPMAGLGEQAGLDRMDVNGDGELEALSIDGIVGVLTGTLGVHEVITHPEGIPDNAKTTRGIIKVSPKETQDSIGVSEGGQVQFLDYMAQLEGVSASGNWADVSIWYIGNDTPSLLGTINLGPDNAALVSRFWAPSVEKFTTEAEAEAAAKVAMVTEGLPARPLWLTLDSIVQVGGEPHARLTPHRLLMTGETFFVDGVEYDVAAILVEDADLTVGEIAPEIKYITLRNRLPKGDGVLQIPELTIEKRRISAGEALWMLPPFNYQHDMVDDVNIPEKPNDLGPDDQKADNDSSIENDIADGYDLIEERIVADVLALSGDLAIEWIAEDEERRFDTNLLEEKLVQEQAGDAWDEEWQWINVESRPWRYTEFILPELPDKPTQAGYTTGDYVLVSSFLTEDSITTTQGAGAVRVKFAHDAEEKRGIYISLGEVCIPPSITSLAADTVVTSGRTTTVHFTSKVLGTRPITYSWDFGDGSPPSTGVGLTTTEHAYTTTGSFTVTLTVTNRCGPGDSRPLTIVIESFSLHLYLPIILRRYPTSPLLQADFTASPTSGAAPLTVVFTNRSTGDYTSSLWDFGDGGTSTVTNPTHTYTLSGTYTVTLTVAGSGSSSTLTRPNYITVTGPLTCVEWIANGSFENDDGWVIPTTEYPATYTMAIAHAGNRSVRAGIVESADNRYSYSSIQQMVTIPAAVASATLRFRIYPVSEDPPIAPVVPARPLAVTIEEAVLASDMQYVLILDEHDRWIRTLVWQCTDEQQWMFYEFDMGVHAGKTVKVHFGAYNDGWDGVTAMYVDDVSLEICYLH